MFRDFRAFTPLPDPPPSRGRENDFSDRLLEQHGYEYILVFRMRAIAKQERAAILQRANVKKIKETLHWKELTYQGQRLLVCYNPERGALDALKREEVLERIEKKIKNGTILSVIENQDYKRYLRIEGRDPVIDPEKVTHDALYDGVYILTSNSSFNGSEIIENYKNLWHVEAAFKQLKSELEAGPIYHWKDRRIRAHIMICLLALILRSMIYKKIRAVAPDASYTEVITAIKALHAIHLKVKNQSVILRTELEPNASLFFKTLGMRPPHRVISSEPIQGVVVRT